ncbi:hypothetical protein N7474_004697 [Penicillium riverlandense]|uniref:uncharacterized protein n=1 Tax=Penicillium riverlandense TaxID=1903569 RepID=UPI0025475F33|nr:uncharacterized protein N7474_004697 [Penicillium riverlandense]KAJ5819106.1 hypothetical protein N7474_004697 [Penicillium riverlandense]
MGLSHCVYSEAKFVRQQKELESVRRKVERYEELLRSISTDLEGPIANRVANALKDPFAGSTKHRSKTSSASSSSSSFGSLDENEVVSEDINRDEKSRATGYIGKNSEVVWMQRLESEAMRQAANKFRPSRKSHRLPTDDSIASVNYHLDHRSLSDQDVSNPFVLPPKGLVDRLFQVYLDKVQTSLPFIRQDLFHHQYHRCYASNKNPGRKWLAIFNLILAIGCAFSRLSQQDIHPNGNEDIFFSRARSLSLSQNVLYDHDDLQQVQAEALMAFFLLVVSQINRYDTI